MRRPPVVVFTKLPVEMEEMARDVVVALVVVAFNPVKFWRVEEPVTRRFESEVRPPVAVRVVLMATLPVKLAAEVIV